MPSPAALTTWAASMALAFAAIATQEPTPTPTPGPPPFSIEAPEQVPASRLVDITVHATDAKALAMTVYQARPGLDADVTADALRAGAAPGSYVFAHDPGLYRIVARALTTDDQIQTTETTIQVGPEVPITPDPIVPGPPGPVKHGPRLILLIHESDQQTPQLSLLMGYLRSGETEKYLADQQHKLLILDDDPNQSTPPALRPYLTEATKHLTDQKQAALLIIDPLQTVSGGGVLFSGKAPATEAEFIQTLKQHGG